MSRVLKALMRDQLKARFDEVDGGLFISTIGLNSEKTYAFRKALNEKNIKYTVLRNSLARMAFKTYGYEDADLDKVFDGSVGMVYTKEEGSAMVAARAVDAYKKETRDKIIKWRGAYMDGDILDAKDAEALKDAPTKEQARAMLLGIVQAPATQMLATLREGYARVVYLLNAFHEKRNEGGES